MSLRTLFSTPSMVEKDRQTDAAFADPQPGDRFAEMYSFWLYVVARNGDLVTTIEAGVPCEFPRDGRIKTQTVKEFQARFSYDGRPDLGHTMDLIDRGNDVSWFVMPPDPLQAVDPCELEAAD